MEGDVRNKILRHVSLDLNRVVCCCEVQLHTSPSDPTPSTIVVNDNPPAEDQIHDAIQNGHDEGRRPHPNVFRHYAGDLEFFDYPTP